ncbi:MAG: hypothetical protein C0594_15395 [Marinilabiliales bacterium]|nr:MAG: hypothetical protein C0594_15395 [Marinilabiliales bacterium]
MHNLIQNIDSTTLYYFLSTIAQVLAAIAALLAVFTHFKISEIKDFLVGDGQATHIRMVHSQETQLKNFSRGIIKQFTGYCLENQHDKYQDRLRDAVGRKSLKGIKDVIDLLAKQEKNQNKTIETNPRGLQYLQLRYEKRLKNLNNIKLATKYAILFSFITIVISLILLLFVDCILCSEYVIEILFAMVGLSVTCLSLTFIGVHFGLKDMEDV